MKLRDLLKIKGRAVVTVKPEDAITTAIKKLAEHDRGSLPVCSSEGELVGIITERDIVRKCFTRIDAFASIKVQDVMTRQVAIGLPEDDVNYAISVMKQKRVRHLPVVDGQKVVGMVSMRDLLDLQLDEAKAEVRYAGLLARRPPRPIV
ncbi:MAG: CBS domain-containing protein [Chloroflexi bacterium]|nr:CBS domain-containing protein [Chloroflexota bacterium]